MAVGLFLASYLYVFPYYPAINNPNENVRVYMTAAIVEEGSYEISSLRRRWGWTNDAACVQWPAQGDEPQPCEGPAHGARRLYYSVKAPLMSWLGVPSYALLHALRGEDRVALDAPTLWWLRTTASGLPMALFFWFFYGWLGSRTRVPLLRDAVYVATALGSVLLGYAHLFASHSLSAAAAFGSFMLLQRAHEERRISWRGSLGAGLLATSATALEYPCVLVTLPLCLFALFAVRPLPRMIAFAAGALLPTLLVMHFQAAAYGNPFTPGHLFVENPAFRAGHESGLFGADRFRPEAAWRLLFDLRLGLWTTTPLLAFATLGPFAIPRERRLGASFAAAGVIALYLVICTMNNWTGGWSIGPRYLVVAVPFVAIGALLGLDWIARQRPELAANFAVGTAAASVAVGQLYALYPHLPDHLSAPVRQLFVELLDEGYVPLNAGSALLGLEGSTALLPLGALCLYALWWANQKNRSPRRLLGSTAVASLALLPHLLIAPEPTDAVRHEVTLIKERWYPHPDFAARPRSADATSVTALDTRELDERPRRIARADLRTSHVHPPAEGLFDDALFGAQPSLLPKLDEARQHLDVEDPSGHEGLGEGVRESIASPHELRTALGVVDGQAQQH